MYLTKTNIHISFIKHKIPEFHKTPNEIFKIFIRAIGTNIHEYFNIQKNEIDVKNLNISRIDRTIFTCTKILLFHPKINTTIKNVIIFTFFLRKIIQKRIHLFDCFAKLPSFDKENRRLRPVWNLKGCIYCWIRQWSIFRHSICILNRRLLV